MEWHNWKPWNVSHLSTSLLILSKVSLGLSMLSTSTLLGLKLIWGPLMASSQNTPILSTWPWELHPSWPASLSPCSAEIILQNWEPTLVPCSPMFKDIISFIVTLAHSKPHWLVAEVTKNTVSMGWHLDIDLHYLFCLIDYLQKYQVLSDKVCARRIFLYIQQPYVCNIITL